MEQYKDRPSHLCSLDNNELIAICDEWIQKLINSGGKEWVMNVPARPNSDPDLVLTELVERFKKTQEPVSAPSVSKPVWDGWALVGRVRERFKDLEHYGWDWKSFYNGWLEGRTDMYAIERGLSYPNSDELPEAGQIAGARWVKGCPEKDGYYCFRFLGGGFQGGYVTNGMIKDHLGNIINGHTSIEWLDESSSSLSTAKTYGQLQCELEDWKEECLMLREKNKEANQFILDLAKEFGEDSLGFDGIQWSIDDFKEAAKKWAAAKEQETAIAFAEWIDKERAYQANSGKWYKRNHPARTSAIAATSASLYELFLQSQTKQQS